MGSQPLRLTVNFVLLRLKETFFTVTSVFLGLTAKNCQFLCLRVFLLEFLNTKFYVMKSKVPTTAPVIFIGLLRLKKRSTEKKTPWERLFRGDRFLSLRMFRYRNWRSSIPLRNVLRQENRDLSSKIHRVSKVEVPRICFSSVLSCEDLLIRSLHRSANI